MDSKATLREKARIRRRELARAMPGFAAAIAALAVPLNIAQGAVVAGYFPKGDEADPRGLLAALAARGHRLVLPCVGAEPGVMIFRRWQGGDRLLPNRYGIAEPQAHCQAMQPDALLVPLLAFDAWGHRLGTGGGYYDRTLEALRAEKQVTAIGIGFAGQQIVRIPHDATDQRLDMIVTETGITRFS
jgi:5-formyltetrahydrofolate cyclo-ligase